MRGGGATALLFGATVAAIVACPGDACAEACARPTDAEGYAGYAYADATPAHFDTPRVRVWYVIDGPHAVRPASAREDGVPDDVARVGEVTEDALASYAAMGYRAPVPDDDPGCASHGGDGRLDVYLVHFAGSDGATVAETCTASGAATRCSSFLLAEANFEGRYASVDEGIRTVLPHEAFHAVQNAYDAALDRYWAEGTAQWAASVLDPSLRDLERNIPAFFAEDGRTIDVSPGGVTAGYLYGAAIWPLFLSLRYDEAILRETFEEQGTSGDAALDALVPPLARRGSSLREAWSTFWIWNASTGKRAGGGYPNAARYPMAKTHELVDAVSDVTSGMTARIFHVAGEAPSRGVLESPTGEHAAYVVPLRDGKAAVDEAAELPAVIQGESLVVLVSVSSHKKDAFYTIRLEPEPEPASPEPTDPGEPTDPTPTGPTAADDGAIGGGSGCSMHGSRGTPPALAMVGAFVVLAQARRRSKRRDRDLMGAHDAHASFETPPITITTR